MPKKKVQKRPRKNSRRTSKSVLGGRIRFNRTVVIVMCSALAIIGIYFVFHTFAASTAVSAFCGTKSCPTSSGFVLDQYGHPVPNVQISDCDGHTAQTADNGGYGFTLPNHSNYCAHIYTSRYPAHYGGTPVAYNNHYPYNTTAGYDWQVIGAACFNNPAFCGAGKIGNNNAVLTHDMAPENNLNFRITNTCPAPTNYPPPGTGHMTLMYWRFGQTLTQLQIPVTFNNFPGKTSDEFYSTQFATSGNNVAYFGLQTPGTAIFSRFGTTDLSNVRTGTGSIAVAATTEGPFVSLRNVNFGVGAGHYSMTIKQAEFDGTGDWYNYYVAKPGVGGLGTYIGGIRFPRTSPTVKSSINDATINSFTEFWDNNNPTTRYPVPYWNITAGIPIGNGSVRANQTTINYSSMPNSDIYYNRTSNLFDVQIGDNTPRCNPATTYNL